MDKDVDKKFQELERRIKNLEAVSTKGATTKVTIKSGDKSLVLEFNKGTLKEVKEEK